LLQRPQDNLMAEMEKRPLGWLRIRRLLMLHFSDAITLEHKAYADQSAYKRVQRLVAETIRRAYEEANDDDAEVVILANSLGAQIISNYLWDAQADIEARFGDDESRMDLAAHVPTECIWNEPSRRLERGVLTENDAQVRLQKLRYFLTTGCNIPLFVSGLPRIQGVYRNRFGYNFKWDNYYNRNDILGWPLRPLGEFFDKNERGASYADLVSNDVAFRLRGRWWFPFINWTPLTHNYYWESKQIIAALTKALEEVRP